MGERDSSCLYCYFRLRCQRPHWNTFKISSRESTHANFFIIIYAPATVFPQKKKINGDSLFMARHKKRGSHHFFLWVWKTEVPSLPALFKRWRDRRAEACGSSGGFFPEEKSLHHFSGRGEGRRFPALFPPLFLLFHFAFKERGQR